MYLKLHGTRFRKRRVGRLRLAGSAIPRGCVAAVEVAVEAGELDSAVDARLCGGLVQIRPRLKLDMGVERPYVL